MDEQAATQTAASRHTPRPWENVMESVHAGFFIMRNGHWKQATGGDKSLMIAAPEMLDALEFVRMTFAGIEASKRKGHHTECPKIVAAAIAKATTR
ncbi:MAG: hypothetical protein ACREFP_23040 [Acetobacteraceae bacterium]